MSCSHCVKRVERKADKGAEAKTIRELVTLYGDSWSLMSGVGTASIAMWRTSFSDWTKDRHEAHEMHMMEKGERDRCGVLWEHLEPEDEEEEA